MAEFWLHCESILRGKINELSTLAFCAWMDLVGTAARRGDTLFTAADLAFIDSVGENDVVELSAKGLLIPEGDDWRLSAYGWSPENEDAP